jgi:coenzyme F420-dependent glucose-6-phosphate dehydrogenase
VIDAYRQARRKAGHEGDGEIVFQVLVSWAEDDGAALEQARKWKGAQPPDHYTDDWHIPQEMYEHGEREVSDEEFAGNIVSGSDPAALADQLRELERLGGTILTLQNNSGPSAGRAIEVLGSDVLPALRGTQV